MARIDLDVIWKSEEALQRCMQDLGLGSQFRLGNVLEGEIDPTDIAYEQGVTGEHEPIVDQQADVFRSMPRCVDDLDTSITDADRPTIAERFVGEPDLCRRAEVKGRSKGSGEVTSRRTMVGMEVCLDHVGDTKPVATG